MTTKKSRSSPHSAKPIGPKPAPTGAVAPKKPTKRQTRAARTLAMLKRAKRVDLHGTEDDTR